MQSIVLVGGGLAAANAAETLRDEGFTGSLTIVAGEPLLPYERPPLSKGVLQGTEEFAVWRDAPWYDERGIRVVTGTSATGIDLAARSVALASGDRLPYDALLLDTGATPGVRTCRVPTAHWCCAPAPTSNDSDPPSATASGW